MLSDSKVARVSCSGLSVNYGHGPVVDRVDLVLDDAGVNVIVGRSGSGKTTLLYALAGLERPTSGSVLLLGADTSRTRSGVLADLRLKRTGFVFQQADLVPELTVQQNIGLPLEFCDFPRAERRRRVRTMTAELGLEECAGRKPSRISGGQAQRAAVGRALIHQPAVVFADEPTGALDSENGRVVLNLLVKAVRSSGATLIMVTHDPTVAERADRVITIRDGRVVDDSQGPARE